MSTNFLAGRHVAVGVGGGIAAYKVCDFIRALRREGALVRVAMTRAAHEFITPLTLQSLSGHTVLTDFFDTAQDAQFGHLHLARWADCFVIAPATADLLARLRTGMANDPVTTSVLAFRGPVLLAPAMNTAMWDNVATQENLNEFKRQARFHVVGPGVGPLADGDVGAGRLAEMPELVEATQQLFSKGPLAGKRVLVTAGPTREPLDPVRFISNPSTGKMGLAVASAARALGAQVTVILGPTSEVPAGGLEVVKVVTADEMLAAVQSRVEAADFFVATAAVSDWKPAVYAEQKTKKSAGPEAVSLVRTPDVLLAASNLVHGKPARPKLIGFAAETHDVVAYAKEKLTRKRLDFIVANDVSNGAGFSSDDNAITLIAADGSQQTKAGSKHELANWLWSQWV